jgi:hypothetical protein
MADHPENFAYTMYHVPSEDRCLKEEPRLVTKWLSRVGLHSRKAKVTQANVTIRIEQKVLQMEQLLRTRGKPLAYTHVWLNVPVDETLLMTLLHCKNHLYSQIMNRQRDGMQDLREHTSAA